LTDLPSPVLWYSKREKRVVKNRVREGMVHLSDTKTYMRFDRDYTPDVVQYIKYTLQQGGLLSDHMIRQCVPKSECRTTLLYFLTKTHKSPMTLRPIISQVGSATVNIACFLDQYLQPMVHELLAYLKDSTQFIREVTALPIGFWSRLMSRASTPVSRPRGPGCLLWSLAEKMKPQTLNSHQPRPSGTCSRWYSS